MKKRVLSLLLALVLLAGLSVSVAHAEAPETGSVDVSANVLHLGGLLPPGSKPMLRGRGNASLKETLYDGLSTWAETIDISEYGVLTSDISAIYTQVLNEHPDLFYVTGGLGWSSIDNVVTTVSPSYDNSYSPADVAAYQNATQRIFGMLESDWSDMEKLLFFHDYLVTHCEYDLTYSNYSAYDALVVGSAVCQGYAEAFRDLCVRSGIACSLISSSAINHAWNLVTLNGEKFYIDCTWDDPYNQWYEGRCQHNNFLLGKAGLSGNHGGTDWTDGTTDVYTYDPTSSRYDSGAWWSDVVTAVPIIGHIGAYTLESDSANFFLRNLSTDAVSSFSLPVQGKWPVFNRPGYTWNGNFCSFAAANNLFYFALPTGIWSATTAGQTDSVYSLTQDELAQGYAYGIVADGNTLYYNIGESGYNNPFIRKALLSSSTPISTLPAGLKIIESDAFRGTAMSQVIVPPECERIETGAFADSALTYLQVGTSTVIEDGAVASSVFVERR